LEQTRGSTLERQIENCSAFLRDRGGSIIGEPIVDRGRSAYTGANINSGALGQFAERVRVGALGPQVNLVVEELDRLSRQPADVMLAWLSPLVRAGLTIYVTQTNQKIDRAMLDHDMGGLMMLLVVAFGSFTESRKKAERIGAAWESKRTKARAGETVQRNHRYPMWLGLDDDGEFVPIEERAAVVRRIFARRLEGAGKLLIAKELNADGVPTWAATTRQADIWSPTYVGRVLVNRAVMGEWQPFAGSRDKLRKPLGEPIADYYPRIIDPAVFARANDKRAENQRKQVGRSRSISNLLGARARCAVCGGQMDALGSSRIRINKDGSRSRHYFLYCRSAKIGKVCDNQVGWVYDRVEGPLLDHILTLAMDDQHFAANDGGAAEAERLVYIAKAKVEAEARRLDRWARLIDSADEAEAEAAMVSWRSARTDKTAAEKELAEAEEAHAELRGKVSPAEHVRRVAEVRSLMDSDDPEERFQARLRIKTALADIIETMTFHPDDRRVRVSLREGVRVLNIRHDGTVWDFDLVRPSRERITNDPAVKAYLRRVAS
jgi:DNA invertase Pin-like site-specific DNA recombinase